MLGGRSFSRLMWLTMGCVIGYGGGGDAAIIPRESPRHGTRSLASSIELSRLVKQSLRAQGAAGASISVVKCDDVVYLRSFGLADVEHKQRVTPRTPFAVASVAKTFIATALMQLYEQEKFGLDDDVNKYLPFSVRNPNYPDTPITFRMLLSHSSGIADNFNLILGRLLWNADPDPRLEGILRAYFDPSGQDYDPSLNFLDLEPGTASSYCNVCYALNAYLIEVLSGETFTDYCNRHVFAPLDIKAGWFLSDFAEAQPPLAAPYYYDPVSGQYYPYGFYNAALVYPAGGFFAIDGVSLTSWLITNINRGELNHRRILKAATMDLMHSMIAPLPGGGGYGLGFEIEDRGDGIYVGKWGSWIGETAHVFYRTADKVGVTLIENGSPWDQGDTGVAAMNDLLIRLFDEGTRR